MGDSMCLRNHNTASTKAEPCSTEKEDNAYSAFECNICFEVACEPIVTLCGHMYCWPCIYRWLQRKQYTCPVCKGTVEEDKLIPLYGRGHSNYATTEKDLKLIADVPKRPPSQRSSAVPNIRDRDIFHHGMGYSNDPGNSFSIFAGSLRTLGSRGASSFFNSEQLTPEQHQQVCLSRLLLILGSFVIMCLLLF
mmetsp:Transcript_13374/g.18276  ORF Transcript_13374/g.18276 Transcript_13374/m.18276 type:complete len:193 (-) Transcript_13374:85-663(-)